MGDVIGDAQLSAHDIDLRGSLETILGGSIADAAWRQATVGVGGVVLCVPLLAAHLPRVPIFAASHVCAAGLGWYSRRG